MPFDANTAAVLEMMEPAIRIFRSAVADAADRVEATLEAASAVRPDDIAAAALGSFAQGRIDVARFSALAHQNERHVHDDEELAVLRRGVEVLRQHARLPRDEFVVDVPTGARLSGAVGIQFAELGRAFGAIFVAELVRNGRYDADEHSPILHGLPRYRWHRSERAASPPLVVTIDGADLWAGEMAQYLDGNQKIVFLVRAPAPPAPLVRLITPGTLVMQTTRLDQLAAVLRTDGPVAAALMPDGAAEFLHLPDASRPLHERLSVTVTPRSARKTLPSWSGWQQEQEMLHLVSLATRPAPAPAATNGSTAAADPAGRLAAWLLAHADAASAGA